VLKKPDASAILFVPQKPYLVIGPRAPILFVVFLFDVSFLTGRHAA
jgi:hypothetical protein